MDYAEELLQAINLYDEHDPESQETLRYLVCTISEDDTIKSDSFISKLLYIASQKMRVFGYNHLNDFKEDPDIHARFIDVVKNEVIIETYKSETAHEKTLDKSQKDIIDFFNSLECKRMLVSAPTSYGKTFLMREIVYHNRDRYNNVLLVFPTVALLIESTSEMDGLVKSKELDYQIITSVNSNINPNGRNIFVYTPERTMQLLAAYPEIEIDFFFYDEVYKIDEGYYSDDEKKLHGEKSSVNIFEDDRTKTFRVSLYLLSKRVPEYYLAGPNLKQDDFGKGMRKYLDKNNIQLREVVFEPTVRIQVNAHASKIEEKHPLITTSKEDAFRLGSRKYEKVIGIARYIKTGDYGKTIFYCTNPSKVNEYAGYVARSDIADAVYDKRLLSFINHIGRSYDIDGSSKEWKVIDILRKGCGIHHGKLPRYIQKEILEQFNKGNFYFLFCTSTIIEGINTRAKNIVILNDTKGWKKLTAFDIKNIGGRAGRYYHYFIGRIFYAEPNLLKIQNSETNGLNFVTFDEPILDGVDLDNAEYSDLETDNADLKRERMKNQESYSLPRSVFIKNRLIPYEHQEKLLRLLLKDEEFDRFRKLIENKNLTRIFLKDNYLDKILDCFNKAGLIEEHIRTVYAAIGNNYFNKGFKGLLGYEIDKVENIGEKIDGAYRNAFKNMRDIVEYRIPKAISLFEPIFIYVAENKGASMSDFSLSKVIGFYETGVRSPFGAGLVEFGFPVDTIRKIESKFKELISMGVIEGKAFYLSKMEGIHALLDDYEKLLIVEAVKSIL
ncbi:MAG: helicase-related protein [Methanosarcina mazei]|nr:helicase-related protein [Methanosarcina mazei]